MTDQIELLAQKAIRRIEREGKFAGDCEMTLIHARAVRAAKDGLKTNAASAAVRLHNRINELMVERGLARRNCLWLEVA